jgi:FAD/FMN-containing dehydrogenase/Fe-S oxidoreductase
MDQERERIQEDLRGLLDGDVRCDDVFLQMYASDASIYELRPLGVVRPRGVSDVVACVQYAAENEIPLHARGAGTGLAGESLGPGLVLDFSHSMRRILETGQETVRIQPGVVCEQLNRHLGRFGRKYGPDPATAKVSTMGGILALDGSGSHYPRYGSARDTVVSMQVVLADGTVMEAGQHQAKDTTADETNREQQLVSELSGLVQRENSIIDRGYPKSLVNCSGYQLQGVFNDGVLDLARIIAGSEGTLALITEATVRTVPLPLRTGLVLLFFDRLESAARGALEVSNQGVTACDLMDRRLLMIARESNVNYDLLLPPQAEAMLLVEVEGESQDEVRDRLQGIVVRLQRRKRLAFDSKMALEDEEIELFWSLAKRVVPGLYRLKGSSRPLPFVEDIAVPPAEVPDFLVRMQNVLKAHEVTASLYAHASHGQLHIRPFLDLADPANVRTMQKMAKDLYREVMQVGGTISGEHGDGLSRSWYVRQQYGTLYDVFREVKRIFDPQRILNPGKVVADAPQPLTANLRPVVVPEELPARPVEEDVTGRLPDEIASLEANPIELQLAWNDASVAFTARACNGCGACRTQLPDERMCPIFRYGPREEASPRAKANLMRAILTGRLDPGELAGETLKSIADLCVHCHQCRLECPAHVDIPKLMVECKSQYVLTNGLRPTEWFLSRVDRLSSWGSLLSPLTNWAIANRQMRWMIERVFGIAQGRKLPRFASRSFLRSAHRRRLTKPTRRSGRKVLYFVDVYANWHDVQLADALVAILEHNGVAVYVPPNQMQAGAAAVAMGAAETAKRLAQHNVSYLAEAVRQGYHIVTTEPSAALCLTYEYPSLIDDDDTRLVAANTSEACTYLWKMHQVGKLELDFRPVNAVLGYHWPCHLKALEVGTPGYNLLRLVPGLVIQQLEHGCSGMAGTFGLKRENYRSSLRAGWGLIASLRDPRIQLGTTECSACKMQMEQGTTKPTIHPLKVLALSYDLMPDVATLLTLRGEELVVT